MKHIKNLKEHACSFKIVRNCYIVKVKNAIALFLSLTTSGLTILFVLYLNWDFLKLEINNLVNEDLSHLSFRSLFPIIFSQQYVPDV